MKVITYKLDGVDLSTYGIRVSASRGVLDLPSLKQPQAYQWPDYHGEIVDLESPRYNPRSVVLDVWIETKTGMIDFANKVNRFCEAIMKPGLHQLLILLDDNHPLVYMVYLKDGLQIEKKWREIQMYGTFQIKLEEPEPVKKVVQYTGVKADITFRSPDMFNVYWGDGKADMDVSADTPKTISHTYDNTGIYYICFSGNVSSLSTFTTNGLVTWQQ